MVLFLLERRRMLKFSHIIFYSNLFIQRGFLLLDGIQNRRHEVRDTLSPKSMSRVKIYIGFTQVLHVNEIFRVKIYIGRIRDFKQGGVFLYTTSGLGVTESYTDINLYAGNV